MPRQHLITADGRTQRLVDWARELGVHPNTIRARLERGMHPASAVLRPGRSPRTSRAEAPIPPRGLTLDGVTRSQRAWARELGVHPNTIRWRLQHGWTVRQALTHRADPHVFVENR